jgi:hypothetical protein
MKKENKQGRREQEKARATLSLIAGWLMEQVCTSPTSS